MEEEFLKIISSSEKSLDEAIEYLKYLRSNKISRQEVYQKLESLRSKVDESEEDFILEIMDIVSGWCITDKEVW